MDAHVLVVCLVPWKGHLRHGRQQGAHQSAAGRPWKPAKVGARLEDFQGPAARKGCASFHHGYQGLHVLVRHVGGGNLVQIQVAEGGGGPRGQGPGKWLDGASGPVCGGGGGVEAQHLQGVKNAVELHGGGEMMGMLQGHVAHASVQGHAQLPDVAEASLSKCHGECREVVWVVDVDAFKAGLLLEQGDQCLYTRVLGARHLQGGECAAVEAAQGAGDESQAQAAGRLVSVGQHVGDNGVGILW